MFLYLVLNIVFGNSLKTEKTEPTSLASLDQILNLETKKTCKWIGHCLGDPCSTYDDCDWDWVCGPKDTCVEKEPFLRHWVCGTLGCTDLSPAEETMGNNATKVENWPYYNADAPDPMETTNTTQETTSMPALTSTTMASSTSAVTTATVFVTTFETTKTTDSLSAEPTVTNVQEYIFGKVARSYLLKKATEYREEAPKTGDIAKDCLEIHNYYRSLMGQKPFKWSPKLAKYSARFAKKLARERGFYHSKNNKYGENLYKTTGTTNCIQGINAWFIEVEFYNEEKVSSGNYHDWGHFTQMVWPGQREVGCGIAQGKTGQYLVCEYSAPGNVMGSSVPLQAKITQ